MRAGASPVAALGNPQFDLAADVIATILKITTDAWRLARTRGLVNLTTRETEIAGEFVTVIWELLENDPNPPPLRFEEEVGTRSPAARKPDGRIDVKVIYNFRPRSFFGMEFKRVRGSRRPLCVAYVREGVMRFVSGKYGPGHRWGSVVGFVIDSDVAAAASAVAMEIAQDEATNIDGAWREDPDWNCAATVYRSDHRQSPGGTSITLLHLLLS